MQEITSLFLGGGHARSLIFSQEYLMTFISFQKKKSYISVIYLFIYLFLVKVCF